MSNSQNGNMTGKNAKKDKPFWNWMMNLGIVKRFCNLGICKKCMKLKIFQLIFNYEMITYIFYGVMTTVVNFVAFALCCMFMGISTSVDVDFFAAFSSSDMLMQMMMPLIANLIAWVIALLFAFFTNKFIVFGSRDTSPKKMLYEFGTFTLARLFSFVCEELILFVAPMIRLNLLIAKIIAAVLVVIMNYVFSKLFIFKNKSNEKNPSEKENDNV